MGKTLANIAICLIQQTNYLLDRQIRRSEKGGIRERMTRARLAHRCRPPG